jgi:hypothetical protein
VGALGVLGVRQPDGTFVTSLADLRTRLVEMAATGEAVCVDGLASRVQGMKRRATERDWAVTLRLPMRDGFHPR